MIKRKIVIFDLDGTLINSAPEILLSLTKSIKIITNLDITLNENIIGPPLKEIISKILSIENKLYYQFIEKEFKKLYDNKYCIESKLYQGMSQQLEILIEHKVDMILATNKRVIPTIKILKKLNIYEKFREIYCIDSNNIYKDKADILIDIKKNNFFCECIYIGDRQEDFSASSIAKIKFYHASWGYNNKIKKLNKENIIKSPDDIFKKIFQ
jgi:phosphoglycolate phosphatase